MTVFTIRHKDTGDVITELSRLGHINLNDAYLNDANLREANLRGADLRGANLKGADLRGADLADANLSNANLRGADLSNANLSHTNLSDASLRDANLSEADLKDANLSGTSLSGANLKGANLSGRNHYRVEGLHLSILAALDSGGELEMGAWHTCNTTHCRAGWAIHLAGKVGYLLEAIYGQEVAGALIHQASCPWMDKIPYFYSDNETALADIKRCAELELERLL